MTIRAFLCSVIMLIASISAWDDALATTPFPSKQKSLGVSIEFEASHPVYVGDGATLDFRVSDAVTNQPIRALRPESAVRLNNGERNLNLCGANMKTKSRRYGSHTPVQFNSYIVALNSLEGTLSVMNPGRTSRMLIKKIELGGSGNDIALAWLGRYIYVTVEPNELVVVDGVHMEPVRRLEVGTHPHHLAIQPDGKYVWVAHDGDASVSVIDTDIHKIVATVPVGRGHHDFAMTDDSRYVAVTNQEDHTVTLISVRDLAPVGTVAVGRRPHGVGYSSLSRSFYVANEGDGTLTVINVARPSVHKTISVGKGVRVVRFEKGGRWGYALNREENTATIVDATTDTAVETFPTGIAPDDIVFEYDWAFIRNAGSADVTIVSLRHQGLLQNFPVGHFPPNHVDIPQDHSSLVSFGDGHQVLVPNPADGAVYQMMAGGVVGASRVFETKGRGPTRAVVYWRGLREVSPGLYRRVRTFDQPGRHEIGFYVSSPQVATCFELTVLPALPP
ncbi:MAG: hypothetical protein CMH81_04070 [Nitrospiraceae bacterium]|nr:hypothetical protein [Nitrospiraceae bacterium]